MNIEQIKQTYEEAAIKTAMWWADKSFRTSFNQNNGGEGFQIALMNILASESQKSVTEEKIKLFESKLVEFIMLFKDSKDYRDKFIEVDYHPDKILVKAAEFAKLDIGCFPCKSYSKIDNENKVFVRFGYGKKIVEI
jgi:hypothetical protein